MYRISQQQIYERPLKHVKKCSVSVITRERPEGNFQYDGNVLYLDWGAVHIGVYFDKTD